MAEREDDQTPGPAGPAGDGARGSARSACRRCGVPLAADQRYCVSCGARRGVLSGAVAGTVAAGKGANAAGGAGQGAQGAGGGSGWSWMPSPPAIAIAVIGMLALGVGLGSAMSEIASSAPLSTILLEYPRRASEAPPPAEEAQGAEEAEAEAVAAESQATRAEAPEETAPLEEIVNAPSSEEVVEGPLPEVAANGEPPPVPFNPLEEPETELPEEGSLPEVEHTFLIVLGEAGYEETFGAGSGAPYLSRVLPRKGELLPNYYGVTSGVLANEIALLSGQGPTAATAANCPDYTPIAPGTVSSGAEQVEGNGCVYGEEVRSLPTELGAAGVTWRAYVQEMENGGAIGQPFRCRKPVLGAPDLTTPSPDDGYVNWRNPVVYFSAIAAGEECEKHDVGFELLAKDLAAKKRTPTLSLIFPEATALKALVPAIMASPAYAEGGLILITAAEAPQAGEGADPSGCCLAPEYPNLPAPEAGAGGGKVGLLMISPFVEPGRIEEAETANHFTLLKTLATMLGVEPIGYAAEAEVSTLGRELFLAEEDAAGPTRVPKAKSAPSR